MNNYDSRLFLAKGSLDVVLDSIDVGNLIQSNVSEGQEWLKELNENYIIFKMAYLDFLENETNMIRLKDAKAEIISYTRKVLSIRGKVSEYVGRSENGDTSIKVSISERVPSQLYSTFGTCSQQIIGDCRAELKSTVIPLNFDVEKTLVIPKSNMITPNVEVDTIQKSTDSNSYARNIDVKWHEPELNSVSKMPEKKKIRPKKDLCSSKLKQELQTSANLLKLLETNSSKVFKCGSCNYETTWKSHLNRHVLVVHNKFKGYQCDQCSYCASNNHNLIKHVRLKHEGQNDEEMCLLCSKKMKTRSNLKIHMRTVHSAKSFSCTDCKHSSALRSDIRRHYANAHQKIKKFSCKYCFYSTAFNWNMKKHYSRVHSDR